MLFDLFLLFFELNERVRFIREVGASIRFRFSRFCFLLLLVVLMLFLGFLSCYY